MAVRACEMDALRCIVSSDYPARVFNTRFFFTVVTPNYLLPHKQATSARRLKLHQSTKVSQSSCSYISRSSMWVRLDLNTLLTIRVNVLSIYD